MSKMKHLLRKLHIHHNSHRGDSPPSPPPQAAEVSPETTDHAPAEEEPADFNFFEEEFQVQLALAISASDPDGREDAETAQIKAAKQISLGCSPSETPVDSLSLRYWSYNFVNYDEKVMDGFYDVYGIPSNPGVQGKMPNLIDLQAVSVSDNIDYEVILVNHATDPALCQLEESVYASSVEHRLLEQGRTIDCLIQKIADLIVGRMGGPVSNADEMLKRWNFRSYELRNSLNSVILPLGCLDVGLSRHRALLFKVLADRINLPCMLVKGSYYTGTDEGAVNLIKFDSGSEYIIDLMGAPGALIPAELPADHLQHSELDMKNNADCRETIRDLSPVFEEGTKTLTLSCDVSQIVSRGKDNDLVQVNQTTKFENEFGSILPSLCRSNEGLSRMVEKTSDAQKLKVEDVSKYVISASKNPDFAHRLHAVLLESGSSASADFLLGVDPHGVKYMDKLDKFHLLNGEKVHLSAKSFSNIACNGMQSIASVHDVKQQLLAEELIGKHLEMGTNLTRSGKLLPPDTTDEGCLLIKSNKNDAVEFSFVPVVESALDVRPTAGEQSVQYVTPFAIDLNGRQHKAKTSEGFYIEDKKGKVLDVIKMENNFTVQLTEAGYCGPPAVSSVPSQRVNPLLGDASSWEISWEELQIGERIGIGSYGEVYRAEWNATEVAVKKFMDQDISGDALTQFKCEIEIMLRLRHPNLVLFMGAVTHPPNLSILTEYLPRGSLFKLLHRPNNHLDEKRRLRMAIDVAKGMNYLHTSHPIIVHRDLKTPNLLVDKNWGVKVCDFGLSRLKHHTFLSSKSSAGTPEWMAPEVLRNEPSNEKSDVYSFGVILWELATLRVPWSGMNSMQVVGAVGFQNRHLDITEDIDPTVAEIILKCWHPDTQLRPSFSELIYRLRCLRRLQHPGVFKERRLNNQINL